ncbi:hypothetical protein ABGB12_34860 [Actinocorallia sp. B10E7]|uniref:hypothetical protein n=1 Tax=Actinocorallia sp. B10E7 TaxID=3153558 RepID=UPI00325D0BA9
MSAPTKQHDAHVEGTRDRGYQLACRTCGEKGVPWGAYKRAVDDLTLHLSDTSPVPRGERCQRPRDHRLKPWEYCGLCAGQTDLLALLDLDPADLVR